MFLPATENMASYFLKTFEYFLFALIISSLQWNGAGYDNAKLFAKKFTHISPVWLQLKLNDDEETTRIEGTHDIDTGWMRDLRKANPDIKIVPRVMLDNWYASQLIALLTNTKLPSLIGRQLVELAKVSNETDILSETKFDS